MASLAGGVPHSAMRVFMATKSAFARGTSGLVLGEPSTRKAPLRPTPRPEGEGAAVSGSLGLRGLASGERVLARDRDRAAAVGIEERRGGLPPEGSARGVAATSSGGIFRLR